MIGYGAKTEESTAFHVAVYDMVQQIPRGHVCTYGHIARLIGRPENSRQVGFALKHLPNPRDVERREEMEFHSGNVPWWRVINSQGKISFLKWREHQLVKLREEIEITDDGEVDLEQYGWFPDEEEL
jgi:methylated-DNA-protein-cysteine methyltransferase related protein